MCFIKYQYWKAKKIKVLQILYLITVDIAELRKPFSINFLNICVWCKDKNGKIDSKTSMLFKAHVWILHFLRKWVIRQNSCVNKNDDMPMDRKTGLISSY